MLSHWMCKSACLFSGEKFVSLSCLAYALDFYFAQFILAVLTVADANKRDSSFPYLLFGNFQ